MIRTLRTSRSLPSLRSTALQHSHSHQIPPTPPPIPNELTHTFGSFAAQSRGFSSTPKHLASKKSTPNLSTSNGIIIPPKPRGRPRKTEVVSPAKSGQSRSQSTDAKLKRLQTEHTTTTTLTQKPSIETEPAGRGTAQVSKRGKRGLSSNSTKKVDSKSPRGSTGSSSSSNSNSNSNSTSKTTKDEKEATMKGGNLEKVVVAAEKEKGVDEFVKVAIETIENLAPSSSSSSGSASSSTSATTTSNKVGINAVSTNGNTKNNGPANNSTTTTSSHRSNGGDSKSSSSSKEGNSNSDYESGEIPKSEKRGLLVALGLTSLWFTFGGGGGGGGSGNSQSHKKQKK